MMGRGWGGRKGMGTWMGRGANRERGKTINFLYLPEELGQQHREDVDALTEAIWGINKEPASGLWTPNSIVAS